MIRVLIIGGYGNFGGTIARRLSSNPNITLIIGGRSIDKASDFCKSLAGVNVAEPIFLDICQDIRPVLTSSSPDLVIHTSGPFQGQGYDVAKACIAAGVSYCDLADGREFVDKIGVLDRDAKNAGVSIITGASSVPTLTSAIMDELLSQGIMIEEIDYGIATAQQTRLGLATTAATLSYAGRRISTLINGKMKEVYGWQDLHPENYPVLGTRWMANVDVPDLEVFPRRYPTLKTQRFYAGVEVAILQFGIWMLSYVVRFGLIKSLLGYANFLARSAGIFDFLGTNTSGFHFHAKGTHKTGRSIKKSFYLVAKKGDGPNIPCIPSIWLAEEMARGRKFDVGAYPCIGLMDLKTYLSMMNGLDIQAIWQD